MLPAGLEVGERPQCVFGFRAERHALRWVKFELPQAIESRIQLRKDRDGRYDQH